MRWIEEVLRRRLSRRLIRVDYPFSDGGLYEARHVVHLKLLHYSVPVAFNGGKRDKELLGDLPAGRAVRYMLQYLFFPLGEGIEGVLPLVLLDDVHEIVQ